MPAPLSDKVGSLVLYDDVSRLVFGTGTPGDNARVRP
jgi:hypothetical protein